MVDQRLVDLLLQEGVDFIVSVPCNMLGELITIIERSPVQHIPVCREEEGVGIAAGAALAGKKPLLLMQNSGLGNSINALMSLTRLYELPLFLLMSHRGGPGEQISAQIPMGEAVPLLLKTLGISCLSVRSIDNIAPLKKRIRRTFRSREVHAALLSRELWYEKK
jgi:sulfopyruvate decarboxylase subunit alpha